uniref:Uncharacterized protein n=1 Tax=Anopheles minimus TaxID=112268 RepID=A0A182WNF7_9DIPT
MGKKGAKGDRERGRGVGADPPHSSPLQRHYGVCSTVPTVSRWRCFHGSSNVKIKQIPRFPNVTRTGGVSFPTNGVVIGTKFNV